MPSSLIHPDPASPVSGGWAGRCDHDGLILQVLQDDLSLSPDPRAPLPLSSFLDPGSHAKARLLIQTLATEGSVLGWELVVNRQETPTLFYFAGIRHAADYLLLAATSNELLAGLCHRYFDHRTLTRDLSSAPSTQAILDRCRQLSSLNSDLLKLQRELAQKNEELRAMNQQLRDMQQTIHRQQRALKTANQKLSREAACDPLTGLCNRRSIDRSLDKLLRLAVHRQRPLSVLLIDIDYFKSINDTHGHSTGDLVLQQIAGILNTAARQGDIAVRYGGEEFALILPSCDSSQALAIAHRLLHAVRAHPWSHGPVTISVGAATTGPFPLDQQQLLEMADRALYHCKRSGRDRAAHAQMLPASHESRRAA